jgi:hypothetical protein
VIELGTLPGAHNFLRERQDEYSFSSWALSWGAEEARHSLLQCRYLRHLGRDEARQARAFQVFCKEMCARSPENTALRPES